MKSVVISANTAGDNTIITGVTGKAIRVLGYMITSANNNMLIWKSGSTAISGELHIPTSGNLSVQFGDNWPSGASFALQTNSGESLILTLDSAHMVGGHITYVLVGI